MYVVSDVLPKMSYMTVLDYYAYTTIVFVMGIIAQSCIMSIYTNGKKKLDLHKIAVQLAMWDLLTWLLIHILFVIICCVIYQASKERLDTYPMNHYKAGIIMNLNNK